MRTRESAEFGNGGGARPARRARTRAKSGPVARAREAADRLDYIADMVLQLEVMSASAGFRTLAVLLALAGLEARRRSRTRRPAPRRRASRRA